MRAVRAAIAVAACGVTLAGCVAYPGGADPRVGPTSARLLARGHSDDSPAHYQFRYSREASDLRTGGGRVTPMRTVPAHTPVSGDQSFSETVSDLSPGAPVVLHGLRWRRRHAPRPLQPQLRDVRRGAIVLLHDPDPGAGLRRRQ